jgi:hypothetical protein
MRSVSVPLGASAREIDPVLRSALEHAAWNITLFHSALRPAPSNQSRARRAVGQTGSFAARRDLFPGWSGRVRDGMPDG